MHTQLSKMDVIYNRAQITIIAGCGDGPEYGLPGVTNKPRQWQKTVDIGKHKIFVVPPDLHLLAVQSSWMTRAWTFQEAIFSRRRLIFTDQQVFLDCEEYCFLETILTERQSDADIPNNEMWTSFGTFHFAHLASGLLCLDDIGRLIEEYANRKLTHQSDILKGILGIFGAFEARFANLEFTNYWGLPLLPYAQFRNLTDYENYKWRTGLLYSFRWHSTVPCDRRLDFLSWSWVGWKGQTSYALFKDWTADPTVTVKIEMKRDDRVWQESFDDFMSVKASMKFLTPTLIVDAWTLKLRFVHLPNGPPKSWILGSIFNRGGGYYVQTRLEPVEFAPLALDLRMDPNETSRLTDEEWECVVIGFDDGVSDLVGHSVVMVCGWDGDIARRIGLVCLNRTVESSGAWRTPKIPLTKTWKTGIRIM